MSKLLIREHNVAANEIIEREMTDEELAQKAKDEQVALETQTEESAKAAARQAILDRLGLSEEEARLLLG